MISLVRGEVVVRRPDHVVLMCGGLGYRLLVSAQTLASVPAAGQEATLHAHLVVRDDALTLYGFASEQERDLFLMLLGVQAVGPKVALAVLSCGTPRELMASIAAGDGARLRAAQGVGKRTADRIVAELRSRIAASLPAIGSAGQSETDGADPIEGPDAERLLAREGLLELGFTAPEAHELLSGLPDGDASELIAGALRMARAA